MSIRKTTRGLAALGLALALTVPGDADEVTLSLPQAEMMTQQALKAGEPKLAYALSDGLLQANPKNGRAHYLQAVALGRLNEFSMARKSAGRAFRYSETDTQKFQAAELAAKLSFADERLTISQLWLRRAVHYAPNEAMRNQMVQSYRKVRHRNPLYFNVKLSTTPSNNVNNGANSPLNLIDGVPITGILSPSAQALSGTITNTELQGSYRISESENHETRLTGLATYRHVSLSDPTPGVSGDDLSSSKLQAGIRHTMAGTQKDAFWQFDLDGGRTWYGGDLLYDFASAGVQRRQKISSNLYLSLGTELEQQLDQTAASADTTLVSVFSGLNYVMPTGSTLGFQLQYRGADSSGVNRTSEQWAGIVSFRPEKPLGPAHMSFSIGHSTLDYDQYSIGVIAVPGGRVDTSTFGNITATFNDWGYMGFVPTLSVQAEKSRSNISRFDVDETSVSLGVRSEF